MSEIKIFVSNRIDTDSNVIENPIYIPVRCGAIFDERSGISMQGDDTGDNISERRNSFCEFTVQYWAWKNVDADYYGLCHYRRYLNFQDKMYSTNSQEMIMEYFLDDKVIKKYELNNQKLFMDNINGYDAVLNYSADVTKITTPLGSCENTVFNHWKAHAGMFFDEKVLPVFLETIKKVHPEYFSCAKEYFQGEQHRGFNCYVMKKELFQEMCKFQFDIMFEMERILADTEYTEKYPRTIGYLGEMLYGIFSYYLIKQGKYKINLKQLIYFEQTELPDNKIKYLVQKILFYIKIKFENILYFVLPKNSVRRNLVKKLYFKLIGKD